MTTVCVIENVTQNIDISSRIHPKGILKKMEIFEFEMWTAKLAVPDREVKQLVAFVRC